MRPSNDIRYATDGNRSLLANDKLDKAMQLLGTGLEQVALLCDALAFEIANQRLKRGIKKTWKTKP